MPSPLSLSIVEHSAVTGSACVLPTGRFIMMPNAALPAHSPPSRLQPLAELPALVIRDAGRDVRGMEIRTDAGQVLGTVSDLLADPDQLVAEFLIVAPVEMGEPEVFVPLATVASRHEHLVLGGGLQPIELRYVSTLRLSATTATAAALVVLMVWLLQVFAC